MQRVRIVAGGARICLGPSPSHVADCLSLGSRVSAAMGGQGPGARQAGGLISSAVRLLPYSMLQLAIVMPEPGGTGNENDKGKRYDCAQFQKD